MLNESFANLKHLGNEDPPFYGVNAPIYKESDPFYTKPQDTPFFNSVQFKLWDEGVLEQYNKLLNVLVKWRDRGWCDFNEITEWIETKQNWIVWIRYSALIQVPAEELHYYLYEMNILDIPSSNPSK